ncbi:AAA family ATPase [Salegentibacter sediminis]|uniref:AAA family ATPase n=1 Tax=Salegentibacter sediminis TaxID=1930251 RepID=UPI0009BDB31D|nr:AAA family ATPase [Salegentibacter sediminis]
MKILRIEFKNINSLKGEHEIDFTGLPFTGSSLFAITGPTGSGKSTILDVISLALFNNIPRMGKVSTSEINKTGAILTRNQQEAMAAVTYQGKAGKYRSQWSISTARTGNLRDYEMELSNAETGKLIDLKKSEVPGKNEELIGLNYNQFIKSVLLAQGEFAQFLKAKKEERGELLEKITGTGIYRQLGIKAFLKYREENREIQAQQNRIEAIKEDLLSEEEYAKKTRELKAKDELEQELKKKIENLNKNLELKQKILLQEKEIKNRENENSQAEDKLKTFEQEHGLPLKEHEKIEECAEELRSWTLLRKELTDLELELKSIQKNEQLNHQNRTNCLSEAEQLTGAELKPENIEEVLGAFYKKISWLEEERRARLQEYRGLCNQVRSETRELQFKLEEENPGKSREELLVLGRTSEEKKNKLQDSLTGIDLSHPTVERQQINERLEQAREAWRKEEELKNFSTEIKKLQLEAEGIQPKLKILPQEIQQAKDKCELLGERQEKLELKKQNQLLQAKFEDQRHILKDGKACPLCGALDHPYAEELPKKDDTLEVEIKKTGQELSGWSKKLSTFDAELNHHKIRLEGLQRELEATQTKLAKGKKNFTEKYGHLQEEESRDWEELCNNWQKKLNDLEAWEKEQHRLRAIKTALPLLEKLQKVLEEGKKISRERESLYQGKDISQDTGRLKTRWTSLQQEQKHIKERLQETEKRSAQKKAKLEALERKLFPEVKEKGFEDISSARQALMPEAECRALRVQREEIKKTITAVASSLKLLHSQLEKLKDEDIDESRESLEEKLSNLKQRLNEVAAECRELYSSIKNHESNLERLEEIKALIVEKEKQIRRWRLLDELIGDSKGKKFNDFAQDLSLSQLLHLANHRLKDLSDRYRIDKPEEEEDDGLVAIDEHMGGQRRSVKTLSGGETFILSLSMALALSDLASRNVEINSLFIDEGFGTLDPETLDQTLDTLEKLQAESSKMIGIISHVDSLKERIATQIQLQRNGQGYSSLEIKG